MSDRYGERAWGHGADDGGRVYSDGSRDRDGDRLDDPDRLDDRADDDVDDDDLDDDLDDDGDDDVDDDIDDDGAPRPRRRRRGAFRIAVVSLVALCLLGIGTVAGYVAFLNWRVSTNVTHRPLVPERGTTITGEDGVVVTVSPPARDPDAGEALNILLIGSDSRDLGVERGRSDVMVLMHIADERDRVDLIHFPRDLLVDIPGYANKNKINASYAFGGAPLLIETMQPLIGVPIDHVALVNFQSFQSMTDAIGGVDVQVEQASPGFAPGVMHMDGETGLRFVRERYALSQGDISRGQRQLAFIKAIMMKALSREVVTNPVTLATFVDAATQNLVIDEGFGMGEMRELGFALRGMRGEDITFVTAPWTGLGSDSYAGSIVLMNPDQMAVLREHLQADTMEAYVDDVSPQEGFG